MFKAPITESKQVEHIVNERRILEEATSEFCVGMVRAYQDRNCLYLLQDLVSGDLQPPLIPLNMPGQQQRAVDQPYWLG